MSGLGVTSTVRAMLASPSACCWSTDAIWRQAAGGIRNTSVTGVSGRRGRGRRVESSNRRHSMIGERGMRERETRAGEELLSGVRVDKVKRSLGPEGGGKGGGVAVCKWVVESFRGSVWSRADGVGAPGASRRDPKLGQPGEQRRICL